MNIAIRIYFIYNKIGKYFFWIALIFFVLFVYILTTTGEFEIVFLVLIFIFTFFGLPYSLKKENEESNKDMENSKEKMYYIGGKKFNIFL